MILFADFSYHEVNIPLFSSNIQYRGGGIYFVIIHAFKLKNIKFTEHKISIATDWNLYLHGVLIFTNIIMGIR